MLISLSIDDTVEKSRDFVSKNDMPWKQGFLGKSGVPEKYGVEGIPAIFLVGREGQILAKELRGSGLNSALAKWLK